MSAYYVRVVIDTEIVKRVGSTSLSVLAGVWLAGVVAVMYCWRDMAAPGQAQVPVPPQALPSTKAAAAHRSQAGSSLARLSWPPAVAGNV